MPKTTVEWVNLRILEESDDVRRLSTEACAAYIRLRVEFFTMGRLPNDDDDLKKIAGVGHKLSAVRDQLQKYVFTHDWRNPKWEAALSESEKRLVSYRGRTDKATGVRMAKGQQTAGAPAPAHEDYDVGF
jgi:hypothetical protein